MVCVVRIGSMIVFRLGSLWKAKFFILCDVVFLVRLQGKFEIEFEMKLTFLCSLAHHLDNHSFSYSFIHWFVSFTLHRGGRLNYTIAMDMTTYLDTEKEYVPWDAATSGMYGITGNVAKTSTLNQNMRVSATHQAGWGWGWGYAGSRNTVETPVSGHSRDLVEVSANGRLHVIMPAATMLQLFAIPVIW